MVGGEQGGLRQPARVAAVAFVGWSGAGKTTLLERLLPVVAERGLRVGYLKSAHHGFDMDRPGKDTDRLYRAGAARVGVASPTAGALRFPLERRDPRALLEEHFPACDLVLVEGFKESDLPKIEVAIGEPVLDSDDPTLLAVVCDDPDRRAVPRFRREDLEGLSRFVAKAVLGRMGGRP